jgi:hypothetical protein
MEPKLTAQSLVDYFRSTFKYSSTVEISRILDITLSDFIIFPSISDDDVKRAIRRLRSPKSVGLSGIPSLIIKDCLKIFAATTQPVTEMSTRNLFGG